MIITIHQPNFCPYLGFFEKILLSDIFVVYDDVQYSKEGFINRNKIIFNNEPLFLTIPVLNDSWKKKIKDVILCEAEKKQIIKKHTMTLLTAYKKCEFFEKHFNNIKEIYESLNNNNNLMDFNMKIIRYILDLFEWKGKIVYSSELNIISTERSEKLYEIVKKLNGTIYLSGNSGETYLNKEIFNDIKLVFQKFKHPTYKQKSNQFYKNMSIIDYIFNCDNKKFYDKSIFNYYLYNSTLINTYIHYNNDELMKNELVSLEIANINLLDIKMLDIGIGCGRTTKYFIDKVSEYIGIDYSEKMINICKNKFIDKIDKIKLLDVRNIDSLNIQFNFILFSFNGIDYMNINDREHTIHKCSLLLEKNGKFLISTHNLLSNEENVKNIQNKKNMNYYINTDKYNLITFYSHPKFFIDQLKQHNLKIINIIGYYGDIYSELEIDKINYNNHWLYFLCEKSI